MRTRYLVTVMLGLLISFKISLIPVGLKFNKINESLRNNVEKESIQNYCYTLA